MGTPPRTLTYLEPLILSPGIGDNRPTASLYYGQDVRETLRALPLPQLRNGAILAVV